MPLSRNGFKGSLPQPVTLTALQCKLAMISKPVFRKRIHKLDVATQLKYDLALNL